jgi:hypothetical protein
VKYTRALLVEPYFDGTRNNFRPIVIHAGGVAWFPTQNLLYVASTSLGLRVFDLNLTRDVAVTGCGTTTGWNASLGKYCAAGYNYVIPEVNRYAAKNSSGTGSPTGSCDPSFSFIGIDTSTPGQEAVVSGEYCNGSSYLCNYNNADAYAGRLFRWPLTSTRRLATATNSSGLKMVTASKAYKPNVRNMQGVSGNAFTNTSGDDFYINSSALNAQQWLVKTTAAGKVLSEWGTASDFPSLPQGTQDTGSLLYSCNEGSTADTGLTARMCIVQSSGSALQ